MTPQTEHVLSVFELANSLKRIVETTTEDTWVEGEVGRLQRPGSGHLYFTLKDENRDAMIDCVMYKREAARFAGQLTEGARVQLRGKASFYPPRGRLQWIAEIARPQGQGAHLLALEKLKNQLVEEGLTASSRKRSLPDSPKCVGVVTSKTGAVFSDICTVIGRRAKVRILLAPAIVQGDGAVDSILLALSLLERARPDVVILGRGGGSSLDLMAFSDERVVRMVAGYSIPIVSAVGHEVDFSLTDLVADARAATPSEAAEMVVPDVRERALVCRRLRSHLVRALRAHLAETRLRVDRFHHRLRDPRFVLALGQQTLDELRGRLHRRVQLRLARSREELERNRRTLYARHPRGVLAHARADLGPLRERLGAAARRRLDRSRSELGSHAAALGALSPLAILGRGYALALNGRGQAVRDVGTLSPGDEVTIRVRRGTFSARVQNVLSTVENHDSFGQESPSTFVAEGEKS